MNCYGGATSEVNDMGKPAVSSGRIETILAVVVLAAVLGLFVKFHGSEPNTAPAPKRIVTHSVGTPAPGR